LIKNKKNAKKVPKTLSARPRLLIVFRSYELYNMVHENFNQ